MNPTYRTALYFCITLATAACGSDFEESQPAAVADGGAAGGDLGGQGGAPATSTTDAASSSTTTTTAASTTATSSATGGQASGLADLGTLVILGDSISDEGGEGPFYYDVLHEQLELHYGKTVAFESQAQAGTTTLFLDGQIAALPESLDGPVAVVITSGGNNMQYNVVQTLAGLDGAARQRMADHIDAALAELLTPDRFGAGVDVSVFEANIYDASDGEGNFGSSGCAMPVDAPNGSTTIFEGWNTSIADAVFAHQQTLIDIHGHFANHGFNQPDSWYAPDCIHPNGVGHAEIAGLVLSAITGI